MRTTLNIEAMLLKEAKKIAAKKQITLAKVVEDALREGLNRRKMTAKAKTRISLPCSGQGGLQPGVDIDSMAELTDVLEADHGSYRR